MKSENEKTIQPDSLVVLVPVLDQQAAAFFRNPKNLLLLERIAALAAARQATDLKIIRPGSITPQEITVAVHRASIRTTELGLQFTQKHVARELLLSREMLSKATARNAKLKKALWDAVEKEKYQNCGMRRQRKRKE